MKTVYTPDYFMSFIGTRQHCCNKTGQERRGQTIGQVVNILPDYQNHLKCFFSPKSGFPGDLLKSFMIIFVACPAWPLSFFGVFSNVSNKPFSQKTCWHFTVGKNTGVHNKINDGWIPFQFQGPGIVHAGSQSYRHGLLTCGVQYCYR